MPTKRIWGMLILAVGFYFLANQTQVGWVYLMSDGLLGLIIISFFYARGMLTRLQAERDFRRLSPAPALSPFASVLASADQTDLNPPAFFEDDPIEVILRFRQTGLRPAFLVHSEENCPFAPPDDQKQPVFLPGVFKNYPLNLSYRTICDRRGVYTFSTLDLSSTGPFGFFRVKRSLETPSQILIYPQYHPLKRLRLLETYELAERQTTRVGIGSQVVSTREYRPGDSLRQIHWRSTARAGKLVVKEFAEEDQPSLTVALDLEAGSSVGQGKFSTFETAVRIAASLAYYATHHDVPFRLVGASPRWTPPATPLSWWAALTYLAKAQNDGREPLAKLLAGLPPSPFVVVLISRSYQGLPRGLAHLQSQGTPTLAVFITPDGALPDEGRVSSGPHLVVKSVSPHNWAEMMDTW